ncbi:vanadium-dependent haloperoxidase [Mucilaginibacter gotjawali]|uniref:PAP2 superfamily protein n=2 Tax=Mucilaginibacter gotjawali TaxID=1550579 RepID=A0A0X8X2H2_9SPHI|nr:vanadium-dependent haloperoxidase [Mucilaginibacter gotjawali]MBB3055705.1 hypothetical protein [Mucilaginibacter gotjawali]BAU54524.1 PAP2 superfamily protein [Mucilaginibacter gotjawali]
MKRTSLFTIIPALILSGIHPVYALKKKTLSGDVVIQWNQVSLKAAKIAKQNTNEASRTVAIEAIAVYDAVNSIKGIGKPYHYFVKPGGGASAVAAAAQAAHDVLVNYFPAQKAQLDSVLTVSLQGATDGPVDKGQKVGAAAAADIIALRANDGAAPNVTYPGPAKPGIGEYRPTPSGFLPGINQQWGKIKPFLLTSGDQFRPAAPPAPGTDDFKKALAEVADIGSAKSTTRTVDQTHIAQFYKQDAELTVNEAARILAKQHGSSLEESALVFLLTDLAEADARIALFDAKYNYLFWRPVTALNADADGLVTNNYATWLPLLTTPPHPSYPCGHCGTVAAGFEVLKKFYGDKNTIELHTTTAGEPSRVIGSLTEGEQENDLSRLYGGIHYRFDIDAAQQLGLKIAAYVLANGPKANK